MSWRRESLRVAIVGCAVAVVLTVALAVIPMRTWQAQQERETELAAQLVAAHDEVTRLEAHACRAERVGDVALRARQQFNLVAPGDKVYRVILPAELAENVVDPDESGACVLGSEPPPTTSTTTTTSASTSSVATTIVDGVVMMLVPVTSTSISTSVSDSGSGSGSASASVSVSGEGSGAAVSTSVSVSVSTSGSTVVVGPTRAGVGAGDAGDDNVATSLPTFSTRSTSTVSVAASTSSTIATILVPYPTSAP